MWRAQTWLTRIALTATLLVPASLAAQTPPAPATGATAICKDGTVYTGARHSGACRGHGGVQSWGDAAASPAAATSPGAAANPGAAAAPSAAPTTGSARPAPPVTTYSRSAAPTTTNPVAPGSTARSAAAPAAPGQVWVNTQSQVYHCAGDQWFGKTKHGAFMTEAAARAQGAHPAHGKACAS